MKSYTELMTELTADEFIPDAEKAAEYFNSELAKMFGTKDYKGIAGVSKNLGTSLTYQFADTHWKVTIHNSDIRTLFMMHMTTSFGRTEDMDKFSIEKLAVPRGFKYRKITGKSPMEATKKLVMWFKKNKQAYLDINIKS